MASLRTMMHILVACGTERNQVLLRVISRLAAMLLMMNLKARRCAAYLASPVIPLQHFFTKLFVRFGIQPQRWLLWSNPIHDTLCIACSRNACRCSSGRNLKNLVMEKSSISGSPWSRLAPARKSAQIISRQ